MRQLIVGLMPLALAGALLVGGTSQLHAQARAGGGGGAGGAGGGSSLGGSFGGSGGSSMGSSGSAFGGSSSSSTGSRTGGGSGGSSTNANYGSTSFLGTNYYNPQSFGLSGTTSSNGQSSIGGTSSTGSLGGSSGSAGSSASSSSNSTIKAATSSVKFGQPLYNVNPVSTFTQPTSAGTASLRANTSSQNTNPSPVRVSYTARVGFTAARVPLSQVVSDFQQSVAASPELSNPSNRVEVVMDGDTVVLRGVVQDARERALAETLASLTPGVRGVRNELAVRDNNPDGMASR